MGSWGFRNCDISDEGEHMTEREMRRLSRADLLEMLIDQSKEMEKLRQKLEAAEAALARREIIIGSAGSIAEASLRLNGVFEAAQAACEQYIDNVRRLNERQDALYRQFSFDKKYGGMEAEEAPDELQDVALRRRRTQRRMGSV